MPARGFLPIWSVEDIGAAFRLLSLKAKPAMDKDRLPPLAARCEQIKTRIAPSICGFAAKRTALKVTAASSASAVVGWQSVVPMPSPA
jgi:hypothetical protein